MIINTNSQGEEDQTISYIRNIASHLDIRKEKDKQSDSLALSQSDPDSLRINLILTEPSKKKTNRISPRYTSPYKQSSLSIKKIMKSKGQNTTTLVPFAKTTPQSSHQVQTSRKSPYRKVLPKYMCIPPLMERLEKNEVDKLKSEAKFLHEKREREGGFLSNRQKTQKWADFLLRQRLWEQEKKKKIVQNRQRMISRERQQMNSFTPRSVPKINIEDHIKSVKRKKLKLEEQLREISPNQFTWKSPTSPIKSRPRSPLSKQKNPIRDRFVSLQSQREVQFLVEK